MAGMALNRRWKIDDLLVTSTILPLTAILILLLIGIISLLKNLLQSHSRQAAPASPEKNLNPKDRTPGIWTHLDFKRPPVQPYPDWNLQSTKPLPYRPFRYGPYNITMGIRRMKWDEWIELDNQYPKYHKRKVERIAERGPTLSRTAPEAYDGACELLEEL